MRRQSRRPCKAAHTATPTNHTPSVIVRKIQCAWSAWRRWAMARTHHRQPKLQNVGVGQSVGLAAKAGEKYLAIPPA
jgi:hypothetical protein